MDPLGFALEHFDAIGQWREDDRGAEINSKITLGNTTIENAKQFREALLAQGNGREYLGNVVEKMLIYALGRGVTERDAPTVREIVRGLEKDGYRWSALVQQIAKSTPFQMRTAAGSAAAPVETAATRQQ